MVERRDRSTPDKENGPTAHGDQPERKVAFLFPGQASQQVGMGAGLSTTSGIARDTFRQADEALGFALSDIIFQGPEERLKLTEYAQPAIFVTSIAALLVLQEGGLRPQAVAGHSLGEYSALVAAGALSFQDALRLVRQRSLLMQEACVQNPGTMAAVLGLDNERVEAICASVGERAVLDIANFNSPGQVVISGEVSAVNLGAEMVVKTSSGKVMPLEVSGAFHSRLMQPAADGFAQEVEAVSFRSPEVQFVSNMTGGFLEDPEVIRNCLVSQICQPVLWRKCMETLLAAGFTTFVEIGPGKVLRGLMRRIDRGTDLYSACDPDTISETLDALTERQEAVH